MKPHLAGAMLLIAAVSTGADAADVTAGDRVSTSLATCRAIAVDAARLACFDKAAAAFESAVAAKDIRIVDKQDVRRARRSLFGFSLPRIGLFSDEEADAGDRAEAKEIDTTIAAIRPLGHDQFDLRMADGSTWRTNEPLARTPKTAAAVHISKGAVGNYFLRVEKGRPVRSMRVQ